MDLLGLGNYGANLLYGSASSPDALRAMTEEELRDYELRMWERARPAMFSVERAMAMQNVARAPRRPMMTLSEWDIARARFQAPKPLPST